MLRYLRVDRWYDVLVNGLMTTVSVCDDVRHGRMLAFCECEPLLTFLVFKKCAVGGLMNACLACIMSYTLHSLGSVMAPYGPPVD